MQRIAQLYVSNLFSIVVSREHYGADVLNGTSYAMLLSGTSQFSADIRNRDLTISGVEKVGNDENGDPIYSDPKTNTWSPNQTYEFNGKEMSGYNIIQDYYTSYYTQETSNFITKVNQLRLRSLSVSYSLPKKLMDKTGFIKRVSFSASANNLLLFTNYDGDPELAASGAGVGGSSSVGFEYCGVPATAGMTFGVNLTF